jgi:hypothetical protein
VAGRVPFSAGPQQDAVSVFRVLPEAAGASVIVSVTSLQANGPNGESVTLRVEGEAVVRVAALATPGRK